MRLAIALLSLRRLAPIVAVASVASAAAGCATTPIPGTQLGKYTVTGESTANTCGAGLAAPDPWVFDVTLSQDGTTLYWTVFDGNPPMSGLLSSGSAILSTNDTQNVDGSDGGVGPCSLTRAETVTITLGSGSPPKTFSGTISYGFTVPVGSSCGDQLASAGGTYDTLPCSLSYTMTAAHQ